MSFAPAVQHQLDLLDWRKALNVFVVCLVAGGSFSAGNWFRSLKDQERSLPAIASAAAALPKVEAEAGCETWRAGKAGSVAKQAILSADSGDAAPPSPSAIPRDNCPHPNISVPPAVQGVPK
jgi:hypothetical protein